MVTIEAEYRAVTPVFCAGAKREDQPELRAPSFKGVLRFWWRALAWSRLGGDLRNIQREEERVFGGPGTGCSRVVLRIGQAPDRRQIVNKGELLKTRSGQTVGLGARYFGYGLMGAYGSKGGLLERACYRAPLEFSAVLRCRCLSDTELSEVCRALRAIGYFGGLGPRTRRGYGSLVLQRLWIDRKQAWVRPKTLEELKSGLREFIPTTDPGMLPPYTAFSRRARIVIAACQAETGLDALDLVGREMVRFRSWGKGGKILGGKDSEKGFTEDHDLIKLPPKERERHPQRIAFGLPHNYGKRDEDKVEPASGLDRRASPLFIHIHECGEEPVAVLAFLPAQFLPTGTNISVGGTLVPLAHDAALWEPVSRFLDRFTKHRYKEERFTEIVEVPEP